MIQTFALIVIAYLLGSLSFAMLASKIFKFPDPRTAGSKNPGATNVLRLAGKKAALFVIVGDILKGVVPIVIAKAMGLPLFIQGLVALFAMLGHIFPAYYLFRGGKGVATTMGVLFALNLKLGLACALTWVAVAAIFRYSSLASIVMAVSMLGYTMYFNLAPLFPSLLIMAGVILICHRANLKRLVLGQESKIGQKKV
jgi:glycerol-3-phosphate acyltransferase PlsY